MKGCVHLRIEKGRIKNVFSHLTIPEETGMIHLSDKGIEFLKDEEFQETHPQDKNELRISSHPQVFELGDNRKR